MDTVDLTQAALEALQPSPSSAAATQNQAEAQRLRGRIIGVLIRRGRLSAQRSLEDCASFLQVDAQRIEAWELGDSVPSLPQLEGLTSYLRAAAGDGFEAAEAKVLDAAEYTLLRQRMIGVKLKLARQKRDFALEEVGGRSSLDCDLLARYEFGEVMIPFTHLCVLAQVVGRDLSYFLNSEDSSQERPPITASDAMPAPDHSDLHQFAADDRNQAFIRLAMAFRQINRDDLQRIAEALYNIINEKRGANGQLPGAS